MKINHRTSDEFRMEIKSIPKPIGWESTMHQDMLIEKMHKIIDALEAAEKDISRYASKPNICVDCGWDFPDHSNRCSLR